MPNWCYTTYKCVGEPEDIRKLNDALEYIKDRKTTIIENGFGKWWLGNLVTKLGGNWEDYPCRGEIIDFEMSKDNTMLTLCQQTAWAEQPGVRKIIEEKFPSIKVYWQEEEPGCEVYFTNSFKYFPDKYYLDSNEEPLYFDNILDVARCVSEFTGQDVKPDIESIIQAIDDYNDAQDDPDVWCALHVFEEVDE